jgi:hypothetical protein
VIAQPLGLHADIATAAPRVEIASPLGLFVPASTPTPPAAAILVRFVGNGTIALRSEASSVGASWVTAADADLTQTTGFVDGALPAPSSGGAVVRPDPSARTSYEAFTEDGGTLPSWLKFDTASATFSGIAPPDTGALRVMLVVKRGQEIENTVTLILNFTSF